MFSNSKLNFDISQKRQGKKGTFPSTDYVTHGCERQSGGRGDKPETKPVVLVMSVRRMERSSSVVGHTFPHFVFSSVINLHRLTSLKKRQKKKTNSSAH